MTRLPALRIGRDRRSLVAGGKPFFWMGDTAWELFHRLSLSDAKRFLDCRARQRFNIIQAVLLAEHDGLNVPNTNGDRPLVGNDPERPNERYFRHVDRVLELAARRGLYVAVLPTWADKVVHGAWGIGPVVFHERNARSYGRYLGARWRTLTHLVWVLGGDRPAVHGERDYRALWRAMAEGIDEGAGRRTLKTFHPPGGTSSSNWLHHEAWLDFNMMQTGHGGGRDLPVWDRIAHDRRLLPVKPTLDGEPNYEDHPVNPWPSWEPGKGYFRDHDVRKQLWRGVLAGGFGVTYGHHHVWQMWERKHQVVNNGDELIAWPDAIRRPGAEQVRHLVALMEKYPAPPRVPDQALIVGDPGTGGSHRRAARDRSRRWALVYLPDPLPVTVNLAALRGRTVTARWYSPVTGGWIPAGRHAMDGAGTFTPPGDTPDRVLVLDAA